MPEPPRPADYFHLHLLVFFFGFTAILGRLVSISAPALVVWRTGLAAAGMGLILFFGKKSTLRPVVPLVLTGVLVAAHWLLFFGSARVSNVSVCLAGLSTGTLWTALLEPLLHRRRFSGLEVLLGLWVMAGLYLIFLFEFDHAFGLLLSVISAGLSALFSILNVGFTRRFEPEQVTYNEMLGAVGFSVAVLGPLHGWLSPGEPLRFWPSAADWLWVLLLAGVCTVYAYQASVRLLRKFSAFTLNLTINLEPVYGIVLAWLIFGQAEHMQPGFYAGALLILSAVVAYPLLKGRAAKRAVQA